MELVLWIFVMALIPAILVMAIGIMLVYIYRRGNV